MLNHQIISLREQLSQEIKELKQDLLTFPKQNLIASKNGKYHKYYISNGPNPIYLKKKELAFAQTLALKKYKLLQYQEKQILFDILNKLIEQYNLQREHADDLLNENSPYFELLQKELKIQNSTLNHWIESDYERCLNYPETLIHKTYSGHYVRSKSEVMIANSLFLHHIPYRYECALNLNFIIYPDFTIMHPVNHKIYYWEHFGMMDQASYRDSAYEKMKLYGNHNIIPSINLITTYETQSHPIDSNQINKIIQDYFLQQ